MIIYPAIDLRQGRCVRLRQGDPSAETVFGDDPAAMAQHWAAQGAEWLHVVNLDGALGATQAHLNALHRPSHILIQHPGQNKPVTPTEELEQNLPINLRRLREIRQAVEIPIQFGGGLRTLEDIQLALELGADRVVLGTAAIDNPGLIAEALLRWGPERIVIGIDARDGKVATHGWQTTSNVDAIELGHRMQAMGVKRVVYTDISRDGMLSGVNIEMTSRLGDVTGLKVIASGGVAGLADIETLKAHEFYNIEGVIVGQALYTGALDLAEAIRIGHQPLVRRSAGLIPFRWENGEPQFLLLYNLFFEQWQFPRGGRHRNEGDITCARREFSEEAGLPVRKVYDACRTELHYTSVIRGFEVERTIVYYLAEIGPGEIRLGHENHCEARWVSAQEAWELLTETSPEQLPALDAALEFLSQLRV
ncbi:MAG: HisA/HisF-related TIM barrel protein [Caldilinea sp.]|jgi:phosphoribosylformimino-5-aminoimidazole carboxamide ribotide isomerase|uniref:HisA/HisF-related TIM barrel protein n=1 Tax=Caldilinea sp. TaxID=2293560 RepID=UPI00309C19A4